MKKKLYIYLLAGYTLLMGLSSCSDYLDVDYVFKDQLSLDTVFSRKDYSERWLANVYLRLSDSENVIVASKAGQPFNFLSDDMYYGDRQDLALNQIPITFWKNLEYTEKDLQGSWSSCYKGIRDASTFIHNIDRNREMTPAEILYNKAEARFLRAYFYWLLLRKYGPVPILPDEGIDFTKEYDDLAIARSTYAECAEYIASEMALAAKDLKPEQTEREIARATKGAALAVRARAYLYAASPLFNGNNDEWAKKLVDDTGKRLISEQADEELWAKAAAAAKDVINLGKYELHTARYRAQDENRAYQKTIDPPYRAGYSDRSWPDGWSNIDPFESYREIFNGTLLASTNKELIFTRGRNMGGNGITDMVFHQMPRSLHGWNAHGVTLKHANTYYMNDGSDNPAYGKEDPRAGRPSSYGYTTQEEVDSALCRPLWKDVSKEYLNREPRFYASIAYNGSVWDLLFAPQEENNRYYSQVKYYRGSQDGRLSTAPGFYVRTGLGIKKYVHPNDYLYSETNGLMQAKVDIDIRYAEILLIYAEALNELNNSYTIPDYLGETTYTINRNAEEMSKYIRMIRVRAGLPDFDTNVYGSRDEFRKALKRERQIELFAETHRYYDLRRWKDAEKEETMPVWGCNMNATEDQRDLFHTPVLIPSLPNIFVDKMYLWPISHDELRRNKKLTQNPGWTYYD